jgi:translocation and assembly module TamB
VTGNLVLVDGAASGQLELAGGGVDGQIVLAARNGGQGFDIALVARNATFPGRTPISVNQARVDVAGFIGQGRWSVDGTVNAAGINYGSLFIGQLRANAEIQNGAGTFQAALAGRRGSRFNLKLAGDVSPERIAVAARGDYAGRAISMPRRAVLLKTADGGWALQPTQLSFSRGFMIAQGRFRRDRADAGPADARRHAAVAARRRDRRPRARRHGFGYRRSRRRTEQGAGRRGAGDGRQPDPSGLALSSRPLDLALVGRLSASQLQTRAVLKDEGQTQGRLQALISNLPASGALADRLYAGNLFAQLRYAGPADALWRLSTIELIDVTGPVRVAADVTGTLRQPRVRGSLAGDALGVQSPLTGTVLNNVSARGTFSGSRLNLTSFAGATPNGGRISGSGFVDLSNMTRDRGPRLDLRLAARNAEVLDLANMGATVTGPMRIVSSGVGGTIAGRLEVDRARWQLGQAAATQRLPNIRTREINLPPDIAPPRLPGQAWRYLINAHAPGGIEGRRHGPRQRVERRHPAARHDRGAAHRRRGARGATPGASTTSPACASRSPAASSISTRARRPIRASTSGAETDVQDLNVVVTVTGNSSRPDIAFSSVPALPEEELLARMLFGDGITKPVGNRRAATGRRGGFVARWRRNGPDQPPAHRDRPRPAAHPPRRSGAQSRHRDRARQELRPQVLRRGRDRRARLHRDRAGVPGDELAFDPRQHRHDRARHPGRRIQQGLLSPLRRRARRRS